MAGRAVLARSTSARLKRSSSDSLADGGASRQIGRVAFVEVACALSTVGAKVRKTLNEASTIFTVRPPTIMAALSISKSSGENKRADSALHLVAMIMIF